LASKIEDLLGYPFFCYTVFDLHSSMFAWIELQKAPIPLVLALISIVAVFNIITTLLITVVEKTHSIGIFKALGMKSKDILLIFVFQGVFIGLMGTLTGCSLGFLACLLQKTYGIIKLQGDIYFLDTLPMQISLWHYAVVGSLSIILSFISSFIPASIAVRVNTIKAIRFK
jgi:lipoprotein-releasing system permease protein